MSGWSPCICKGTRKERMKNWVVVMRNYNLSYFEAPQGSRHYSDYSLVECKKCSGSFRTKAKYVIGLPDKEEAKNGKSNCSGS